MPPAPMAEPASVPEPEAVVPPEPKAVIPPAPAAAPAFGAPPPAKSSGGPALAAVGVLAVTAAAGFYVLYSSRTDATDQVAALQDKLNQMQARVQALEARPLPPPPPPAVNLAPVEQRLTALENKPAPVAALDNEARKQIAEIAGRLDSVDARANQLGTQEQADAAKFAAQIAALDTQAAAAAKASSQLTALASKEAQTAALQAAAVALQAGRPLGAIPGAPPALAQFADKAPPTEAGLRLSFAAAADKAEEAGEPPPPNTPFLDRLWDRAQSTISVRKSGQILVGNSVSGTLEAARHALDAGDIAGAVKALGDLRGPAAQAMAPWKAQAQSLIDARAALASVAHS